MSSIATSIAKRAGVRIGAKLNLLPETIAYISAMSTAPTSSDKIKANTRIQAYKDAGVWDKFDFLLFADMNTPANSLINVKNPSQSAAIVGVVYHNPQFGFFSGGGYIDTGYNPRNGVNLSQNSAAIGISKIDLFGFNSETYGIYDGVSAIQGKIASLNRKSFALCLNDTKLWGVALETPLLGGWYQSIRNDAANIIQYQREQKQTVASASKPVPNGNLFLLSISNEGVQLGASHNYVNVFYAGAGITDQEALAINATYSLVGEFDTYQHQLDKAIIWRRNNDYLAVDDTYLYYSADSGVTYPYSIAVTDARSIQFAIRFANGNIIWATKDNTLYKSIDSLATASSFVAKHTDGTDYSIHVPSNAVYPGSYYYPASYLEIQNVNGVEVATWSNYSNVKTGASPVNVWMCKDGGDVVAVYEFGQNTRFKDNGTESGGTTGTLLGDSSNNIVTRHSHGVGFDADNNDFYVTTGDIAEETHWFKMHYDYLTQEVTTIEKIKSDTNGSTRWKSSNVVVEDGYAYWGTDEGSDYGLWRAPVSDIFTTQEQLTTVGNYAAIRKNGNRIVGIYLDPTNNRWHVFCLKNLRDLSIQPVSSYVYRAGEFNGVDFDCVEHTSLHKNDAKGSYVFTLK